MRKIIFVVMFAMTTVVFSVDLSSGNDKGTIVIARPKDALSLGSASRSDVTVMINQSIVFSIDKGKYFMIDLDPGEYLIHFTTDSLDVVNSTMFAVKKIIVEADVSRNYIIDSTFKDLLLWKEFKNFDLLKKYKLAEKMRWVDLDE